MLEFLLDSQGSAVDFETFITSKDYCGEESMYNYWIEQEKSIKKDTEELLITGSIGGGKTFFANYYMAYRLYLLFFQSSCPQTLLGVAKDTNIYIIYFTISLRMAMKTGFRQLYDIFLTTPWFKKNAPINEKITTEIQFPTKKFFITCGSNFSHQVGLAVWGYVLDEANFLHGGVGEGMSEEYSKATELYQQLTDRQFSRFVKNGKKNSLAILVSSASFQTSFIEKRIKAIQGNDSARIIRCRKYEITPSDFSKETFEVFTGKGEKEGCMIESEEQKQQIKKDFSIDDSEMNNFFLKVPVTLKSSFDNNVVLALQNHCGISTILNGSFIVNRKALVAGYIEQLPIFESDIIHASTEDDTPIMTKAILNNLEKRENIHAMYLDLSTNSDTGCLVCFRYDGDFGRNNILTKVFELKIIPPKYPYSTSISKVEHFIIELARHINLKAFGSDNFQSSQLRQNIQKNLGLKDIRLSLDSSDVPFLQWSRAIAEGRIQQKKSEILETEITEAQHDYVRHRIVKRTGSHDDVLQANVGAFFLCEVVARSTNTIDNILPKDRVNIITSNQFNNIFKKLGY